MFFKWVPEGSLAGFVWCHEMATNPMPKPCKFMRFGDIHGPEPYKFMRCGDIHGPKLYKFIMCGDIQGGYGFEF